MAELGEFDPSKAAGVYSNRQIRAAVKSGHVIISPYRDEHVNSASVDVTLGEYFYRPDRESSKPIYNPFDPEDVAEYFGEPQRAIPAGEWCEQNGIKKLNNVPDDHPVIALEPGERILAHTHEFIGIKAPGVPAMQSRSTWGRNGIDVCLAAGWGDTDFVNRWAMEVYNFNRRRMVLLPIGERIAQIVFFSTGPVDGSYSTLSGKYQTRKSSEIDKIIEEWTPDQMLPKAYKDQREMPLLIKQRKGAK